jgi:hypothetical protein
MADMSRCNGYAPISSYAVLGDGRTVPLVARDGAIDWFPATALDARPTFAAVLDPVHGGQIGLEPAVDYSAERHYRPGRLCWKPSSPRQRARSQSPIA